MRKLINSPDDFVDEVLAGILLAHPDQLEAVDGQPRVLARTGERAGRVGIVTGGGSGHLPLFLGYVGAGLCSAVAVGNVFSSPSADDVLAATKASDGGAGVLYLLGNYGGDVMNFGLAADLAELDGIATETVLGHDDVLSAPPDRAATRRGVAGLVLAYKCAGAAAQRGDSLAEVARIAAKAIDRMGTAGVGLSPTILPAAGRPTFELPDGEMEIGIGIHGEPGRHRGPLETADEVAGRLVGAVLDELAPDVGARVAVLVNGLGATPLEELYLLYRHAHGELTSRGVIVADSFIGEYATSLEMAGASITLMIVDDELAELLSAPASSPFFRR
jgi:dihydroxyacetone kinase-like protein